MVPYLGVLYFAQNTQMACLVILQLSRYLINVTSSYLFSINQMQEISFIIIVLKNPQKI